LIVNETESGEIHASRQHAIALAIAGRVSSKIADRGIMAGMAEDSDHLAKRRQAYAHEVLARYGTADPAVEAAFAKVPREAFLGPPPWSTGSGGTGPWSTTSDPGSLYQDELIVLDRAKGINNGQPSLHAACIAALRLTRRDRVLHIGAGTGYYTAILAELAGSVDAYEIEARLAAQAADNLTPWANVTVHAESAAGRPLPPADAIYVSAGASHPDPFWLDALCDDGRLLFPLTGDEGWGGMLLVERQTHGFAARFVSNCGFINCAGLRDPVTAARLTEVFRSGGKEQVRSLTRQPPPGPAIWFAGDGWYLSTESPPDGAAANGAAASGVPG
jgi:protein-L-isoaspartate(D-aspartate) O-methyltransferase